MAFGIVLTGCNNSEKDLGNKAIQDPVFDAFPVLKPVGTVERKRLPVDMYWHEYTVRYESRAAEKELTSAIVEHFKKHRFKQIEGPTWRFMDEGETKTFCFGLSRSNGKTVAAGRYYY